MKLSKRVIGKYIKRWKKLLKLEAWTIFVEIDKKPEGDYENTEAHILVDKPINSATITVFEPNIDDERCLEIAIAHEMTHIVLGDLETMLKATEYANITMDAIESAIDKICDAYSGLLKEHA